MFWSLLIALSIGLATLLLGILFVFYRRTQVLYDKIEEWRERRLLIYRIFRTPIYLLRPIVINSTPKPKILQVSRKLELAGLSYSLMPEEYIVISNTMRLIGLIVAWFLWSNPILDPVTNTIVSILLGLGFAAYPTLWLRDRIITRTIQINKDFPFFLDLIILSMRAGLNYATAVGQSIEKLPQGPIKEEFARLTRDMRAGKTRREALEDLAIRLHGIESVQTFVSSINQSEDIGGEVAGILQIQAEQQRAYRFAMAEEAANKAPVKMIFPLVFFMFPVLFLLIGFIILVNVNAAGYLSPEISALLVPRY